MFTRYDDEKNITTEQRRVINKRGRRFGCVVESCVYSRDSMVERHVDSGAWFPCPGLTRLQFETAPDDERFLCLEHFYFSEYLTDGVGATTNVTRVVLENPEELDVQLRFGHCHGNKCANFGVPMPLLADPLHLLTYVCTTCFELRKKQVSEVNELGRLARARGNDTYVVIAQKDDLVNCCVADCPNPAFSGDLGRNSRAFGRYGYHCRDGPCCKSCWVATYSGVSTMDELRRLFGSATKPKPGVTINMRLVDTAAIDLFASTASSDTDREQLFLAKCIHVAINLYPVPITISIAKRFLRAKLASAKHARAGVWLKHLREDADSWQEAAAADAGNQ